MGSEGHSVVTVHVTGFKKFYGVPENPTEAIVSNLMAFVKKEKMAKWFVLGSCSLLETVGEGGVAQLHKILESSVNSEGDCSSDVGHVIWLHFGVNSRLSRFALETQAVNEATFRCPDELGWQPQGVPVVPSDGDISRVRKMSVESNLFLCMCLYSVLLTRKFRWSLLLLCLRSWSKTFCPSSCKQEMARIKGFMHAIIVPKRWITDKLF